VRHRRRLRRRSGGRELRCPPRSPGPAEREPPEEDPRRQEDVGPAGEPSGGGRLAGLRSATYHHRPSLDGSASQDRSPRPLTDTPAVEARSLTKRYRGRGGSGPVTALDGLDLSVPRGCTAGLLGPNGSGKSTTLQLLLGLHGATSGEARVLGLPAGHMEARRRTGYLPEDSDLHPFLTARETVDFAGALHGMGKADRRRAAGELLERVGLAAEADRRGSRGG